MVVGVDAFNTTHSAKMVLASTIAGVARLAFLHLSRNLSCFCDNGYFGNLYLEGGCVSDSTNFTLSSVGFLFCNYGRKKWTKLVTAIGSALGGILLLLFMWWQYQYVKRWRERSLKQKNFKRNGGLLLQQQLNSPEGCIEKSKIFSSEELEIATENFNRSRILGRGGQGTVYKGMLTDGRIVTIKRSTTIDEGNLEQFINEFVILSLINHRNIVNLLGCCLQTEVPLLKPIASSCEREGRSLATYFVISLEENSLFKILDPDVMKNGGEDEIWRVTLLTKRCLGLNSRIRPSMKEVAAELEEVRNIAFPSLVLQNQGSNMSSVTEYHDFSANGSDADFVETEPSVDEDILTVTTSWFRGGECREKLEMHSAK
ncbi:hypothetical protein MLD38_033268 [Melastoma candidum]|uniref:Uncharacterized protein n=1 Tax=Melastoma candidum TaxID=119954 RepID=A0ACB9M6S1_9MYRT|nr:hypothetical protein MLD38_033268 [Melastoma candidum]